jgi:hypothetical protein
MPSSHLVMLSTDVTPNYRVQDCKATTRRCLAQAASKTSGLPYKIVRVHTSLDFGRNDPVSMLANLEPLASKPSIMHASMCRHCYEEAKLIWPNNLLFQIFFTQIW